MIDFLISVDKRSKNSLDLIIIFIFLIKLKYFIVMFLNLSKCIGVVIFKKVKLTINLDLLKYLFHEYIVGTSNNEINVKERTINNFKLCIIFT